MFPKNINKKEVKIHMNKITENKNSGFSLVELIVVIAIMAVLTSVLAPSLLSYVEKSRMQKDDSAMGEVANSIKLALADQNVYDECLTYNEKTNYSCYVDADHDKDTPETNDYVVDKDVDGTFDKTSDGWRYLDTTRLKDEDRFIPSGTMRGITITFSTTPSGNVNEFKMADARINDMLTSKKAVTGKISHTLTKTKDADNDALIMKNMCATGGQKGQLYNKLRAQIGDSITLSSQTYRNSDYTVFIRMGSLGGNQANAQDAIAVYGQWSGTNLDATYTS